MKFVVVNPASASGRTGKSWPEIRSRLADAIGPFDFALTAAPGDATRLTHDAVRAGAKTIIAVGGDGTINEAINGLCLGNHGSTTDILFGAVTSGTGGDFARSFNNGKNIRAAVDHLKAGRVQTIDLGRVRYTKDDGAEAVRWSNNISSFGFSGEVVRAVDASRMTKMLGGKLSFLWNSFTQLRKYTGREVEITIDNHAPIVIDICTAAICNGRYFGGGMMVAPNADPSDGSLDIIVIRQKPPLPLADLRLLYTGAHLTHPNVSEMRGRRITARPLCPLPVALEIEGESLGRLPATFEVVPSALRILC